MNQSNVLLILIGFLLVITSVFGGIIIANELKPPEEILLNYTNNSTNNSNLDSFSEGNNYDKNIETNNTEINNNSTVNKNGDSFIEALKEDKKRRQEAGYKAIKNGPLGEDKE